MLRHHAQQAGARTVVIGAGINGLVAAALLARAGHRVVLVERAPRIGGFIAAGERTLPGFVHDIYSSWHPLFVAGPAYAALGDELHQRGLAYSNVDEAVTASTADVGGERRTVIAYRDPVRTAAAFGPADGEAYLRLLAEFHHRAPLVFGALSAELGSWRALAGLAARAVAKLGVRGLEDLARDGLSSARGFVRRSFSGWEVDALWTPWLLHAGLGPDHASGGVMLPVFAASTHAVGLPVVTGGAGRFLSAFEALLHDCGAEVRTGVEAEEILLRDGRVTGVATSAGSVAADVVLACVSPQFLYGTLLRSAPTVADHRAASLRYRPGRASAHVHLALDRPVPWAEEELRKVPLVHLSDGADSTGVAVAQAEAGLLPAQPTVVVGQQGVMDPSRAPAGRATLWLQLQEVPFAPRGDARGVIDTAGGWTDPTVRERYVDRVLDRIETFAPGFRGTVLATDLITPLDLQAANPNAVGGDSYAGSAELDQLLVWRPFPGAARHRTPVPGVWHIGAATHPGPGLGGGSGYLAARQLLGRRSARP